MDKLNIVIMGKTGAGKSTLINVIMEDEVAPTGSGQAVTKENKLYSKSILLPVNNPNDSENNYGLVGKKVNLYDTVGLEIDNKITKATLAEINQHLQKTTGVESEKDITIVWFCVNCRSSRFEKYELELIKELSIEHEIPFVIVITQCFTEEKGELEKQIERDLPEVMVSRVLAKEYKLRGSSVAAFGVQELLQKSIRDYDSSKVKILESKLEALAFDKKEHIRKLEEKGMKCIKSYAKKAGKAGIVPAISIPIVHGMCIKMLTELNAIVGINSTKGFASDIIADTVVGVIATPFMGVPVLSAAVSEAYIGSVGETYLKALMDVIWRSTNFELRNNDLMSKRIREELNKRKK